MEKISGGNSIVEYPLFQTEGGGAIPTPPLQISNYYLRPCAWFDLSPILKRYHYRGEMIGGSIKICLGVYCNGRLIGGAVFGNPWHPESYSDNGTFNCIELRRLCFCDEAPKNTESWTIGKAIWWLKKYTDYNRVLSYSDSSVGHTGTIYRAAGFRLFGEAGGGKKIECDGRTFHIRSLSIDRDYARDLAEKVKSGEAQIIETGSKKIWVKDIAPARQNAFTGYVKDKPIRQETLF